MNIKYLRHQFIALTSCLVLILFSSNSAFAVPGLYGVYWHYWNFFNTFTPTWEPKLSRVDPEVNFNWGSYSPDSNNIRADYFRVNWTGYVLIPTDGDYRFVTTTDDGVRLWVDGKLIINDWNIYPAKSLESAPQSLIGGRQYSVRLEYFEYTGQAVAQLKWKTPGNSTSTVIPTSQLDTELKPQSATELLHHYTFDNDWNTTSPVRDIVGNSHGELSDDDINGVQRVLSPFEGSKLESCYAAKFTNGNIKLANLGLELTDGEKTSVSFWMKWSGNNSAMPIGWDQYDLWFYNNEFGFNTWNWDIYGVNAYAPTELVNSWHHITAVFTNGSVTDNVLYVDGQKQSLTKRFVPGYGIMDPKFNNAIVANALTLSGYNEGNDQRFQGLIDNLKIYRGEISQAQVTADMNESNACGALKPLLEWHLDEVSLSAAANEIIDYSGNNNHGSVVDLQGGYPSSGHINSVANGQICHGANISADNSRNNYYALDTQLVMGNRGTISFWYAPNSTSSKQQTLFSGTSDGNDDKYFFLRREKNGKLTFAFEDTADRDFVYNTYDQVLANDSKVHISASWDLEQNLIALHVNGQPLSMHKKPGYDYEYITNNNGVMGRLDSLYFGDNRNNYTIDDDGLHTADGAFDEIVIFNQALSDTQIEAIYYNHEAGKNWDGTPRDDCGSVVARLSVVVSEFASTCKAQNVTVSAWDTNNALITDYSGTIELTTSSNHGSWSIGSSDNALGTLSDNTADDGAGIYQFVASDGGQVILQLSNQHADKLRVSVDDKTAPVASSDDVVFSDNAFVITDIDNLAGSDKVIAARDHQYQVELWTKGSGSCAIAANYNDTNQRLKAWLVRDSSFVDGLAPKITRTLGTDPQSTNDSVPNTQPSSTNVTLKFSAGVAKFNLVTGDVGKYTLNLLDDSRVFANNVDIGGGSNSQVIRPFGLAFSDINQFKQPEKSNSGGNELAGDGFVAAGENFSLTLGAYLYESSDDSNGDGLPDAGVDITNNGPTPAFSAATTIGIASYTPSSGTKGTLTGAGITAGNYAGGKVTLSGVKYSEVGSIELSASVSNYLNASINLVTSSNTIGRFYPDHFMVSAVTPATVSDTCVNGNDSFSYMGQDNLEINYTLKAMSAGTDGTAATVTKNYDNDTLVYAKTAAINYHAHDNGSITDLNLGNRLVVGTAPQWSAGIYKVAVSNANFDKLAAVDGPYQVLQLSISIDKADELDERDFSGGGSKDIGESLDMRFGRAKLKNAFGPEDASLALPIELQYYDGAKFVTNTEDNCSSIITATLSEPLAAASLVANVSAISGGTGSVLLTAPNSAGEIKVTPEVEDWLKFDWDNDLATVIENPSAVATFGRYRGNDRIIFWQELH
ncbi:MAG: hypothetical protein HRU23_10595 [Gammaproteobacteria bacterium]|nr:hypothetical protein [Gammaproteobacteria bacterium]